MNISRTIQTLEQCMWTYNTCKGMSGHGERGLEHTYISLKISKLILCTPVVYCPAC